MRKSRQAETPVASDRVGRGAGVGRGRSLPFGRGLVAGLVGALLAACGGSDSTSSEPAQVSVSPGSATVGAGGTQTFTATVSGLASQGVSWTSNGGTLAPSGSSATFTAPVDGGTFTVTATSSADPSVSGSASVTVTPVVISLSPSSGEVLRGEFLSLSATVTGTQSTGVTWAASCGTLEPSGSSATLLAPDEAGPCQVTATSELNPAVSATAQVQVLPDWVVTTADDPGDPTCTREACSLRAALGVVQAGDGPVDLDGLAVVRFAEGLAGATVELASALPVLTEDLRILGPQGGWVTLDAGASLADRRRVLRFDGGVTAEVHRLRLTGGVSEGAGGLSVEGGSHVSLYDAEISGNLGLGGTQAAGGITASGQSVVRLEGVRIAGNETDGGDADAPGGGASVLGGSTLTMIGGSVEENRVPRGWGGGIRVLSSSLTLEGTEVRGNHAGTSGGGGVLASGTNVRVVLEGVTLEGNEAPASSGGGIWVQGPGNELVFRDSAVRGNRALTGGGVLTFAGTSVEMEGGVVEENVAQAGRGGGLLVLDGSVTLAGVVFRGNRAQGWGGGVTLEPTSEADLRDVTFVENHAVGAGGGFFARGTTARLQGVEFRENVSELQGGALQLLAENRIVIEDSEIRGNRSTGTGGAIGLFGTSELVMTRSVLVGNEAGTTGGAVFKQNESELVMTQVQILENVAGSDPAIAGQGGAMQLFPGGAATLDRILVQGNESRGSGAGISSGTRLTLRNSTLTGNRITGDLNFSGGGLRLVTEDSDAEVENVTISGNEAPVGAGVALAGVAVFNGVSVVGNQAGNQGGGLGGAVAAPLELTNTLLAGNEVAGEDGNCTIGGNVAVTSAGHNLSDDGTCSAVLDGAEDLNEVDAEVAETLADNGGATPTHALLEGSPAIDAGNEARCLASDQRGFGRNGPCDIGAFEFGGTAPAAAFAGARRLDLPAWAEALIRGEFPAREGASRIRALDPEGVPAEIPEGGAGAEAGLGQGTSGGAGHLMDP